jgi:PKD repeat protein
MFTRPGMTLHDGEVGRDPRFGMMRALCLLSFFLLCLVILTGVDVGNSSAVEWDCVSCHGVNQNYHDNGLTSPGNAWGSCSTCHASPPATGAHEIHAAPLSNTTYGDTVTSTAEQYRFGCGHCHSMDVTKHRNGSRDVDLSGSSIGQTGRQVCADCHGAAGPHGAQSCTGCHTDKSMAAMNHPLTPLLPSCETCHTTAHSTPINVLTACGQCHNPAIPGAPAFPPAQMVSYAANIHNSKPTASFTAAPDSTVTFKVNFSAAGSVCPTGYTCTYAWDFTNDGINDVTGSSVTASNTYGSDATVMVKLTVTTNAGTSASVTKAVTPAAVNRAPVCNAPVTAAGFIATINDASSDPDGNATAALYVNWGDGSPVQSFALKTSGITHTYMYKGTYSVKRYVRDSAGAVGDCGSTPVVVGPAASVNGTLVVGLTGAGGSFSVTTYVKLGAATKAFASIPVNGAAQTFALPADTYGVFVYPPTGKKCYTSYTSPTVNVPYVNGTTYPVVAGSSTPVDLICQ